MIETTAPQKVGSVRSRGILRKMSNLLNPRFYRFYCIIIKIIIIIMEEEKYQAADEIAEKADKMLKRAGIDVGSDEGNIDDVDE